MVLVWPRKPPAGEGKRSIEGAVPMRQGDQRHPTCIGRRTFPVVLAVPRSSLSTRPWTHASLILCYLYATPALDLGRSCGSCRSCRWTPRECEAGMGQTVRLFVTGHVLCCCCCWRFPG